MQIYRDAEKYQGKLKKIEERTRNIIKVNHPMGSG
jgi:hypothetical protein